MKLSKYITPLLLATALAYSTPIYGATKSVTNANVATLMPSSGTWDAGYSGATNHVFSIDEDITIYLTGNVNLKSQINISEGKTLTIINNCDVTNSDNNADAGILYGAQMHGVKIDNQMRDNVGGTISSRKCMFYINPGAKLILDSRSSSGSGNPNNRKMQINGMACATIVGHLRERIGRLWAPENRQKRQGWVSDMTALPIPSIAPSPMAASSTAVLLKCIIACFATSAR